MLVICWAFMPIMLRITSVRLAVLAPVVWCCASSVPMRSITP